jgi:hypothetical protein
MQGWFWIQTFYHGLECTTREHLDAVTRGAFFSLQLPAAKELIEKMVANQGWDGGARRSFNPKLLEVPPFARQRAIRLRGHPQAREKRREIVREKNHST